MIVCVECGYKIGIGNLGFCDVCICGYKIGIDNLGFGNVCIF